MFLRYTCLSVLSEQLNLNTGGVGGFLELGRTGTYFLYRTLLALGINFVTLSPIFTPVFILTVSWSAAVLLCILANSFPKGRRNRYPFLSAIITLLALLAGLLSVFAPHLIAKSVWLPLRSIFSFFAVFTMMAVVIGYNYARNGKTMPFAGTIVVLLLLIANIAGIQGIALDQIKINRQDRVEAEEIIRRIQEYEAESGQRVDTISWRSDGRYTWTHPGIQYTFMDMNVRAGARSWSLIDCINYYAGRRFKSEPMPDDIWASNFGEQGWNSFQPEEQIRFGGNKMSFFSVTRSTGIFKHPQKVAKIKQNRLNPAI